MRWHPLTCSIVIMLVCACCADAAIVVQFRSSLPGSFYVTVTNQPFVSIDGSNNVTISNPNTGSWRIYSDNPGAESIGEVTFTGSAGVSLNLLIATPANNDFTFGSPFSATACVNWGGLDQGSTRTNVQSRCSGNLTGAVVAERVVRVDAGGSIQANVSQLDDGATSPQLYAVIALGGGISGSISATRGLIGVVEASGTISGSVTAVNGSITRVETTNGGDLTGDVTAPNGTIATMNIAGSIGTSTALRTITAKDGIGTIDANAIFADITTNQSNADVNLGGIQRLLTRTGVFSGSLTSRFLFSGIPTDGVRVAGALQANITFVNDIHLPITATSLASGRSLSIRHVGVNGSIDTDQGAIAGTILLAGNLEGDIIGGSLSGTIDIRGSGTSTSSSMITLNSIAASGKILIGDHLQSAAGVQINQAQGLTGQVVINNSNGTGAWSGTVQVGTGAGAITLNTNQSQPNQAPHYQRVSGDLGGGAVGLAPFRYYADDCAPASGAYFRRMDFEPSGPDLRGVLIRFYGPIARGPGQRAVFVERQLRNQEGVSVWGDFTDMFTATVNPSGMARTLRVHYSGTVGDLATGRYRISIEPEGVVCAGVTGTPDVEFLDQTGNPTYYYFNIGLDCSNQNCAGSIGSEDFIDPGSEWNPLIDCNGNNISDECELRCDGAHVDHDNDGCIDTCDELMGPCPCNVNGDQYLNSQDFFDFLTCFFGGTCPPGMSSSDYNGDGFTNSQDFFDFLTCFFAGCQ